MARARGMTMHKPQNANETPDVDLDDTDDATVRTDDETTEDEILTELHRTQDDNTYVVWVTRIMGASRHGIGEPHIYKADAKTFMPIMYEKLLEVTKPGEIGSYRIRITRNGQFWRKFDVSVERPPADAKPVVPERSTEVASMLAAFQASQDRMLQMIEQRFQQISAPQQITAFDPFASLEKLTTIIKNITPVVPTQTNTAKELFEAFKSGIDAVAAVGSSDKETGIMDVVNTMLNSPVIARAIEAATAATMMPGATPRPAQQPAIVALPGQSPAAPVQPQSSQQPAQAPVPQMSVQQMIRLMADNPPLQAQAKQACDYLTSLAQRGADIETSAFFVCDNWDRRFIDFLLGQQDWYALICAVSPEARGYGAWFDELVAEVRETVKDADENQRAGMNGANSDASALDPNGNTGRAGGREDDAEMDGEPS